jgi:serine acetyltransferase
MLENIRRDIARVTRREPTWVDKLGALCFNLGLHAVLFYRLGRWLHLHPLGPLGMTIGAEAVLRADCTRAHGNMIGTLGDRRPPRRGHGSEDPGHDHPR